MDAAYLANVSIKVIDLRAGILALTICALVFIADNQPRPVKSVKVDYCVQPVWNVWGERIGGRWVICSELDRYEQA